MYWRFIFKSEFFFINISTEKTSVLVRENVEQKQCKTFLLTSEFSSSFIRPVKDELFS